MNSVTAKELKNLISDKNKNFQVIDVRSKLEWNEGHIEDPRVLNIEANSLIFGNSKINKNTNVYLICESGGRSSFAQMILKTKGIQAIDVLGGMSEYRKLR